MNFLQYCQLMLDLCWLTSNILLLYLVKIRRPFTENVRFLISAVAICHCFGLIYGTTKAFLVVASFHFNFSILLSKNLCFALDGSFGLVPLELSIFSVWLILFERFYASLKFKKNAEFSKFSIYFAFFFLICISFVILFFLYFSATKYPKIVTIYCDISFFAGPVNFYFFLFYFFGEFFVVFLFLWIKKISLRQIEDLSVNRARSKLEMRFQFKKNIEVTRAVLPLFAFHGFLGIFGSIIGIYFTVALPDPSAVFLSVEVLCYILLPAYYGLAPILLIWNVKKLWPTVKIGLANFGKPPGEKKEGDLRIEALENSWNKTFSLRITDN